MDLLARIAWRTAFTATVDEDLLVHAGVRMLLDVDCMMGPVLHCYLSSFAIAAAALAVPSVSSKRKRSYWMVSRARFPGHTTEGSRRKRHCRNYGRVQLIFLLEAIFLSLP